MQSQAQESEFASLGIQPDASSCWTAALRSRPYLSHNKGVTRFEGHKLVEVEQDVEEGPGQVAVAFQVPQREDALTGRLQHVVHLAQHVLKQHRLL